MDLPDSDPPCVCRLQKAMDEKRVIGSPKYLFETFEILRTS